ncbi:hypothetical protein WJX82_002278 [Trebouxia sp. C0006]
MSNHDGGYGSGMALNDRVARRGPNHQTSHKGHVGQDAQGTSHSLLRTPLFGSAVPRRQRTASVKRPSTSWHDAARQLRQRQAAAVNNNPGRIINRPSPAPVDTQVDTEQEHEVAEALFDLANMFARPSPPEPQRKPSHFSSHPSAARSNGAYSKIHRVRGDQEQYRDQGSLKRQLSLPDREGKRVQTRDWHVKPELPSHSTSQHSAGLADAGPGGTVSTPRAVKAAQHMAAPGHTSLGSAAPVSLGLGAFHPGVPPGLPAYFRNGAQAQMSMFAAAPHSFPGLPGFPSGPLQAQLASSQPGQAGFLRGVRWPDTKEASTLQELPSSASPVASDAKHAPGKLVKQEDSKGDSPVPAAPGISAEGLERLIAMGRPQGFLDSHNLAQFGVPEHVLQAIKQPHSQQNQDGRALH